LKSESSYHSPALLNQTLELLAIKPGEVYVDATVGGGGHISEILKKGGRVFGIDCDEDAVDFTIKRLTNLCQNSACPANAFKIVKANFSNLSQTLVSNNITNPSGILFDLGTSFHQLQSPDRGFSFMYDGPLDMRLDKNLKVTASDLIAALSDKELYEIFNKYGEEKYSLAISKLIVRTRRQRPIVTTVQLANICVEIYKKYQVKPNIHPATKIFQALRMTVNDEKNNLETGLTQALDVLKKGGRLAVISFQGLEDKIVKNFFRGNPTKCKILTEKPIQPAPEEIFKNPRQRSAKLRAIEKI